MLRRFLSIARPWIFLLAVAPVLLFVPAVAQGADKDKEDITGRYKALGTHIPSNVTYAADVEISKQGDVYRVQWKSGAKVWEGVGMMEDNKLVVATHDTEGKNLAVMAYRIVTVDSSVKLVGRWSYKGDKAMSTETLERAK